MNCALLIRFFPANTPDRFRSAQRATSSRSTSDASASSAARPPTASRCSAARTVARSCSRSTLQAPDRSAGGRLLAARIFVLDGEPPTRGTIGLYPVLTHELVIVVVAHDLEIRADHAAFDLAA